MDDKNNHVHILISSGQGPVEVQEFVQLLKEYFLENILKDALILSVSSYPGYAPGTLKHASIECADTNLFEKISAENGSHELVKKSTFRPGHKRKRWFAKVEITRVSPDARRETFELKASDVSIKTCFASGPGGQNVNKTESKIQATHIPTGLVVTCATTPSQHQNKREALKILSSELANLRNHQAAENKFSQRMEHYTLERGNAVASYVFERDRLIRKNK